MVETIQESLPAPSRGRKRRGGFLFAALIILALAGVIVYLLSMLNSKKYFLAPEGEQLVVKKGIFFVTGSDRFRPNDPALAGLYEPVELPPGYRAGLMEFDDLPSLNAELATVMLEYAQQWVFSTDQVLYQKGVVYLERLGKLNGLSQIQLKTLDSLNADVDYLEARAAYLGVERTLEDALRKFKKARLNEGSRFQDTEDWIGKVRRMLDTLREIKAGFRPEVVPEPAVPPVEPVEAVPAEASPEVPPAKPAPAPAKPAPAPIDPYAPPTP